MDVYEKILELQVPQRPRVSSDGKKVVYATTLPLGHRKGDNRVSSIWVADVGKEESARQLTSGLFNDNSPQWLPDASSIIFVSDRKEAGKKTGLYQLPLSGGEAVLLTDPEHEKPISTFAISPDGKHVAFLRPDEKSPEQKKQDEDTGDADVFGGRWDHCRLKVIHLRTRSIDTVVTGDYHINDLAWSPDSKSLVYSTQPTPELEGGFPDNTYIDLVDISTLKIKLVTKCKYWPAGDSPNLHWAGDRVYLVASAKEGVSSTSAVVFSVSIQDGSWKQELGGESYCTDALASSKDVVVAQAKNDLYDELRSPSGETYFSDFAAIRGFCVAAVEKSKVFAIVKSTINEMPEVYTFSTDEKTPVKVSSHSAFPTEPKTIALQIHVPSTDGEVELDGVFYYPASLSESDRPKKPLATFVEPHGGPYARQTNSYMASYGWSHGLLEQGYAVFLPNYRGGASHGTHFAGPYVAGRQDHADVMALINHVVKQGFSDPENLIIGGWSQGGALTYITSVRNGAHGFDWRFKAGIAGAGVSDWEMMAMAADIPRLEAELAGSAPWDLDEVRIKARPGSAIREFAAAAKEKRIPPMLLLHGQEDVRVPVAQAWTFQRACRHWGVQCDMVTYPRAGHLFAERKQVLDMMRRVLKFCDAHFTM
ncbi:Hypothetical protein D9617_31g064150 [Elsinoe fawcettii]|nr:Hypothetical protein D9617_31g064150 [Elsinoe fawcettii]